MSVKEYLTSKKKKRFKNIQEAPQGLNLQDFPSTHFSRYQVRLVENEWKPLFQSVQEYINKTLVMKLLVHVNLIIIKFL
jgi:hypothetical protein